MRLFILIKYLNSKYSDVPSLVRSIARAFTARTHKNGVDIG